MNEDKEYIQELSDEKINVQKQQDILKIHLKIFGIFCIVGFALSLIYTCLVTVGSPINLLETLSTLGKSFLFTICLPTGFILIFSPAILILYFLFKKYKDAASRIFFVSLIIPLTNWVYFYIEYFCFNNNIPTLSMVVGCIMTFWVLPAAFLFALLVPKSVLPYKNDAIITIVLTELFGIGMIFLSLFLLNPIESFVENSKLRHYEPVIEKIENYKSQHGIYPDNVDDDARIFEKFKYEPQNSNNDFILELENHWTKCYYYCTSAEYDHCHEGWHSYGYHKKIGKWIKADYSD